MTKPTADWVKLAREAYTSSTTYFDASIRNQIEADLRQFQGLHPRGSKYMSDVNRSRSRLFRPKTRTTIRKNEAVAAEAFFSTVDVVSVTAEDDNNDQHQASAAIMQQLLQYRLTKSIPWFQTLIGGYQDALTVGTVCSYQCWQYNKKKKVDRPMVKLLAIENVRFDPGADWTDPVNTSPYFIELIPMYVKDVKARMEVADDKTGEPKWHKLSEEKILSAAKAYGDTTRLQREQGRTDSRDQAHTITEFSIVWIHKNIVEYQGEDYCYYTLGVTDLLSDPVPLVDRYAHGKRPYVIGNCIIETHKSYPSGLPRISRDVQAEINDIANLRIDNVKFALNKRYFVKRGKQVDVRSIVRNVAGSVTLMDDPENDVKTVEFNDVTGSSYQEQDRLNLDFDDVTGSFSGSSVQSNRKLNETVGGMELLDGSANQVSGYQLRTFVETFVEPVLRQVILLEQYYETDEVILALAGQRAQLLEKFGIDMVTDELLMQELTLNVNVGMGATNPVEQVKKFMQAMTSLKDLLADGTLLKYGLQVQEVIKELFGKLGYRDGGRFFDMKNDDPKVLALQSTIDELMQQLQQKEDPALVQKKIEHLDAQIRSLDSKDKQVDAQTIKTIVEAMFSSMQAAEVLTAVPQTAPVADSIMQSAGYRDPNFPTGAAGAPLAIEDVKNKRTGIAFNPGGGVAGDTSPQTPMSPSSPNIGAATGIHTMRPDSAPGNQAGPGFADGGTLANHENGGLQYPGMEGGMYMDGGKPPVMTDPMLYPLPPHTLPGFKDELHPIPTDQRITPISLPGEVPGQWMYITPEWSRMIREQMANGGTVPGYADGVYLNPDVAAGLMPPGGLAPILPGQLPPQPLRPPGLPSLDPAEPVVRPFDPNADTKGIAKVNADFGGLGGSTVQELSLGGLFNNPYVDPFKVGHPTPSILSPRDAEIASYTRALNKAEEAQGYADGGVTGSSPPFIPTTGVVGLIEPGNVDLHNRVPYLNPDGSYSTIRSMSFNDNGREVLVPTISNDGRPYTDDEAILNYRTTGKHLGIFDSPENATSYAKRLHDEQAHQYAPLFKSMGIEGYAAGGKVKPVAGYAKGGAIRAEAGQIVGPGTGTSDSIPAVVAETGQPAAVSNGEFKVPAKVVQAVGVDFLQGLVSQFHRPAGGTPQPQPGQPVILNTGDFIIPQDVVAALDVEFFEELVKRYG